MNSITTTAPAVPAGIDVFAQSITLQVMDLTVGHLETDAERVLAAVRERIEDYQDISRYVGKLESAKTDRALLRKQKETINRVRRDIEAQWNSPLEVFRAKVKEIDAVYDEAIDRIDELVKGVEAQEKETKRQAIQAYFDTKDFSLVSLERLFNDRWLNKTFKMPDIQTEINVKTAEIYANIQVLEGIPEYGMTVKALYLETLDMGAALRKAETLKENAVKLAQEQAAREARKHQEQITRNQADLGREQAQAPREERIADLTRQALELPEPSLPPQPEQPKVHEVTLKFRGTTQQLYALRNYMSNQGIAYEKAFIFETGDQSALFLRQRGIAGQIYSAVFLPEGTAV